MNFRLYGSRKYRDTNGDNGDGGGGGGNPAPDLAAQIQAAVDKATAGLKATNAALKAEKQAALDKAKAFDGLDLEEVRSIHDQFKNSEDLKLIREGKIDEVLARRNEKFIQAIQGKVTEAEAKAATLQAKNDKFAQRVLNDSIRAAAIKAGVHKHAVDDALLAARLDFQLNEDGDPVQMRDGEIVLGKDGKTPFGPDEWFAQRVETKPHWFPSGNSGSEPAGNGANAGGKTIRRAAFDALPSSERAKVAATHRIVD